MRKWRLFFIAIISFIAILGENWIKKIIPISLCILLNSNSAACYINFNDGRVEAAISNINATDISSNKILTFNQDLPTKKEDDFQHKLPSQIAIPPIIRPAETNLYLQNALPKDFRISSQIPYSSGKQEILLVSPSTGAEQLYTFNVPGSRSFQLFEVEYKKVSAIDFSSLTSTDSLIVNPEQIKSVLNRFKITFANNSLSKITLSDGTTANFFAGQAVIKSPKGQTVETVQISQNQFIDRNIFISQERGKMNKTIGNKTTNKDANLLAKTSESACQAAVSSSLNVISDSLGLWGNKLTTSKSLIIKSVGWAISFGSGAIKSNISTKNPMLQEVNCRPPVQCEEQRVSGGSEIRTDLFQVAKGANRKVNLKFEFFEIPDIIELYFDGKLIPPPIGPQSGPGTRSFDLPASAEYVGVKLIGNDNVNTRWWYVISCSGGSPDLAPDLAIAITKWENIIPGIVGWPNNLRRPDWAKAVRSKDENGWAVNLTAVVTVTVRNQGNSEAPSSNLSIQLQKDFINGVVRTSKIEELKSVPIVSLKPGQEVSIPVKLEFNQSWDLFGDASIIAQLDKDNLIPEINEDNNRSNPYEILLVDPRPARVFDRTFQTENDAVAYLRGRGFSYDPLFQLINIEWTKYLQGNDIRSRRDGKYKEAKAYRQDAIVYNLASLGIGVGFAVTIQGTEFFGEPNPKEFEVWKPYLQYVAWWHKVY